jgi:hypothetical protein
VKRICRWRSPDDIEVAVIAALDEHAGACDVVRRSHDHHVVPVALASQCRKRSSFATSVRRCGHEAHDLEWLGRRAQSICFVRVEFVPRGDRQGRGDASRHEDARFVQSFPVSAGENDHSLSAPWSIRGGPDEEPSGRGEKQGRCDEDENPDALSVQQDRRPDSTERYAFVPRATDVGCDVALASARVTPAALSGATRSTSNTFGTRATSSDVGVGHAQRQSTVWSNSCQR